MVWAPHTKCDTEKLEAVQRRAERFVMSDFNRTSSVTEILHNLNWNILSRVEDSLDRHLDYAYYTRSCTT